MWLSLLKSKMAWAIVTVVIFMIFVGALLYKNQSLKLQIAEKDKEIVALNAQLESAKQAIAGYKGTLEGKNSEITGCQEQVKLGNEAIDEYKNRIDKLLLVTKDWKSVPIEKRREILDEKSNAEAVRILNDAIASDRVRGKKTNGGVLPTVYKTKKVR